MTAPVLLLSQWSEPALSWGIEVAVKALVCGLLVYLVHLAVGRRRVLARSVLWNATLAGLLILPAAIAFTPRWDLPVWPSPPAPAEMHIRLASVEYSVPSAAVILTEPTPEPVQSTPILPLVVCGVYLLGACVGLARFARGLHGVAMLRRDSVPVESACWRDALARWRRELGLPESIELLQSERVSVPLMMGARSPVVIIPGVLAGSTDRPTIDAVLLHELAHIGRHDFAWNLLLKLVQTMYWFQPVGWCLGKILHQVREDACDAVCIHWLGGPREYVSVLVELVVSYVPRPAAALGLGMTRTSRLSRRLQRLAGSVGNARYALGRPLGGLGLAAIGAGVVVLGSVQLTQRAAAQDRVVAPPPAAKGAADNTPEVREVDLENEDDTDDILEVTVKRQKAALDEEQKRVDEVRRRAQEALEAVATRSGKKVAVVKVREGKLQQTEKQPCSLVGYEPLRIYSRLSGVVSKTMTNVGDVIQKGQILAVIEVPDAEAQIARARGGVARAEAELAKAQVQFEASQAAIDTAKAHVDQTTADVERAEATLAHQKKQYERMKGLAENKAIDTQLLDESEEKLSAARADVKATNAKIAASKAQLVQAEADAKVKQAFVQAVKVDVLAAREDLNLASMALLEDNRVVRAPADGIVAERDADIGEAVGADRKPMFVLNSSSLIAARVELPEKVVLLAKKGMSAVVKLDAQPRVLHEGTVTQLAYNIDPTTRTLAATIAIPNPEGKLRPGMFGTAEIVVHETPTPVVPESAVLSVTEKQITRWYCYKWVGAHFVRVQVNRRYIDGKQCAISEGLQVGDEVALDARSVFSTDEEQEPQDESGLP